METHGQEPDYPLRDRVAFEQVAPAGGIAAAQPRAGSQSCHEDGQHERLGIRRMTEEQLQVMRPDGLVNETGEPRDREYEEEDLAQGTVGPGIMAAAFKSRMVAETARVVSRAEPTQNQDPHGAHTKRVTSAKTMRSSCGRTTFIL